MMNRQRHGKPVFLIMALCVGWGMLEPQARADDKVGAPIVLPGQSAPAATAQKSASAPAATTPFKKIVLPSKLVASMAAARSKPAEPEPLPPQVKQAAAPEIKSPSPEVHAPAGSGLLAPEKKPHHKKARPAKRPHPANAQQNYASQLMQIRQQVARIISSSSHHFNGQDRAYFRELANHQAARATVVSCSDSSVKTDIPAKGPVDGLYLVSDLGNQLQPMVGTIEYGIRQLHTPVLIFVSHSACDSIKTVAGEQAPVSQDMEKAVNGMGLPQGIDSTNGALLNINNQVESAILTFSGEVEAGHLAILGGYFDFHNALNRGAGKLVITNLNGESDPATIRRMMQKGQYFHYSFMH